MSTGDEPLPSQLEEEKAEAEEVWNKWQRCVLKLLPGDRWPLEHGGVDPNQQLRIRDDREVPSEKEPRALDTSDDEDPILEPEIVRDRGHPGRFCHAAPLCFLVEWIELLKRLRPPPEQPFHRFWRHRRQREMGLASPAAVAQSKQLDSEAVRQPQRKKPRLAQQDRPSSTSDAGEDKEYLLQPSELVQELLTMLQDPQHLVCGGNAAAQLSPEEHRELASLFPDGHELSAEELAKHVQESKTQLIQELVLEDRVRTLLEFGANPNPPPFTKAMHGNLKICMPLTAGRCPPSVIRLLLEANADPNWGLSVGEYSALWIHRNTSEVVRWLLEAGASPDHFLLSDSKSLSDPVEHPVFLSFVQHGAPVESFRLLLEYNPEIIGRFTDDFGRKGLKTPISEFIRSQHLHPHIQDIVLKTPYPLLAEGLKCKCELDAGCWQNATFRGPGSCGLLRALVRLGHPTRGLMQPLIKQLSFYPKPEYDELLEILRSVTEEGQTRNRQEYLGGFWRALMQVVPSLSGVVASLVLQAIVPEFQLRIA